MKKKGLLFFVGCLFSLCACEIRGVPSIKPKQNEDDTPSQKENNSNEEGNNNTSSDIEEFGKNAVKLSFKSAASFEYLQTLNNKEVTINGYMATSSPVDGSFIFLMNMPYQNCPFCKPNTSQLSNTIEVYPEAKEKFSYTTSAIKIVGTMIVAEDTSKPFNDPFGYEFVYKIIDADYRILKDSDLSGELALWQKFANTSLITDIYKMLDYIDFVCKWPSYYINPTTNADGTVTPGFYLWAGDAQVLIETTGKQYNYGYKQGYFDDFITRINKISTTGFETLIEIINEAKDLATYAVSELDNSHYTSEEKYIERFDTTDRVFKLNDDTLPDKADNLYYKFANWLSSFEM